MAKRFFYVCAGLLCLAMSYHLGARSAGAQVAGSLVAGSYEPDTSPCGVDASGNLWILERNSGEVYGPYALPHSGDVVAVTASYTPGSFFGTLLYTNGDAYHHENGQDWQYVGNVLARPTASRQSTWGLMKARYR